MPNFSPSSEIHIGRVPWDASYRHTRTFGSASSQTSWMKGRCTNSLTKDNYTYVRMNNSIRVPFNAERLYTYNYVMYQNANYGSKWFYAFIVGVNYVNENMTELVLELDVMQTWMFDYTLVQGFIEREHVNDDSLYANLVPEPEFGFNSVAINIQRDISMNDACIVIETNHIPSWTDGDLGSEAVSGGVYTRVYHGAAMFAFNKYDITPLEQEQPIQQFLTEMNVAGQADSVTNVFQFPRNCASGLHTDGNNDDSPYPGPWGGYAVTMNDNIWFRQYTHNRPASLHNGYTPHNNKMFSYPYCYCRIQDLGGHFIELKYELWNRASDGSYGSTVPYRLKVPFEADANAIVVPLVYDVQQPTTYDEASAYQLVFPVTAKCSWVYSAYQTWSAQNHLANVISVLGSAAAVAVPAARGLTSAASTLGRGLPAVAKASNTVGDLRANAGTLMRATNNASALTKGETAMMGAGVAGLGAFVGEYNRHMLTPDVSRGSASGNTLTGTGEIGYYVEDIVIQEEFARILDDFWDMYGYQVDCVKVPNVTGRPYWNYVKMQNSCHRGNVPAEDMTLINQIYDKGITFWHTDDIGNYSLDNSI